MSEAAILEIAKRIVGAEDTSPSGTIAFMKGVSSVDYIPPDTRDFFLDAMKKGAAGIQRPGESEFAAFTRYTAEGDGHTILKAERMLARAEMAPTNAGVWQKNDVILANRAEGCDAMTTKAAELRKRRPEMTQSAALLEVYNDPANRADVTKALNPPGQILTPAPGGQQAAPMVNSGGRYDPTVAPGTEGGPPVPITPSLAKMYQMATDLRNQHPAKHWTEAQAFSRIMETPAGAALYRQHLEEQLRNEIADQAKQ